MVKLNGVLVLAALAISGVASASQRAETLSAAHARFAVVFDNRQSIPDVATIAATAGVAVGGAQDGLQDLDPGRSLGDHDVTRSYRAVASDQEISNAAQFPKERVALSAAELGEPKTLTMVLSGLGLMVYLARRRKKSSDR